ncbi:hypothetical protein A8C32_16810 [Flavivirga aquatica]|uniref:DoxX family protein n=1 Tax=Flavivirga aquatica TaxID=1849968 RepID=A0A1E5T8L7_9FLAO|nr:DoxX family membrane protein [Flavivirga aquatica]OEK07714.1 hypothetical protein A8C32_16810 [Flavivirga aquatica]
MNVKALLRFTYSFVTIVVGLDKFTNILRNWSQYAHGVENLLPLESSVFIIIIGVIEIVAGILVLNSFGLFLFPKKCPKSTHISVIFSCVTMLCLF